MSGFPEDVLAKAYEEIPWNLSRDSQPMGLLLPALIYQLNVHSIIEIGIADGFQTACAARALHFSCPGEGTLVSVDIDPKTEAAALRASKGLKVRHEVVIQDSMTFDWRAALRRMGIGELDLAIIDGCHEYEPELNDLLRAAEVLKDEGAMVVHDVSTRDMQVVRAVEVLESQGWQIWWLSATRAGYCPGALLQRAGFPWARRKGQDMAKIVKLADLGKAPEPNGEAVVAKPASPGLAEIVTLADCCVEATRRWEASYVRIGGAWSQVVIVREKSEGGKDFWRTIHVPGPRVCQYCATPLDADTPTRRYHRGFAPLDMQIDAVLPRAEMPAPPAGPGGRIPPPAL